MILNYDDSEVKRFHPIVERSLSRALQMSGIGASHEVRHHERVGSVEMDFAVVNKETRRTLCVVEVKRTPAAVKSLRYQLQAKSYVDLMSDSQTERPYFILTNIECSYLFKNDRATPQVYKQIVKPGLVSNVSFEDVASADDLVEKTARHFANMLDTVIADSGEYDNRLDNVVEAVASSINDYEAWKSNFARMAYEYIRGAFASASNSMRINDIRQYRQRIDSLRDAFDDIDFSGIFNCPEYADTPKLGNATLTDIYNLGKAEIDADDLVTTLHNIISEGHRHEGEVPTDIELARLMLAIAKEYCREIKGCICDPAAGSGNLISCASEVFGNIAPRQIKANDRNPLLLQLLTLRLGLKFPHQLSPDNAPTVSTSDILDLPRSYFDDVDLILMNPPMVSAVTDTKRRQRFIDRMGDAKTNVGQMPLEGLFLEYVNRCVKDNTVVVTLMPKTHLTATGSFAVALRNFLLTDFGLCLVFDYPDKGIFKDVTKGTVVLVGRKGVAGDKIVSLSSVEAIPDICPKTICTLIADGIDGNEMDGVTYKAFSREELGRSASAGWRMLNPVVAEAYTFVTNDLGRSGIMLKVGQAEGLDVFRGRVGNNGLTDILFIDSNKAYKHISEKLKGKLSVGMRNAKCDNVEAGDGDSRFLDIRRYSQKEINEIVKLATSHERTNAKQQRRRKTRKEINDILQLEATSGSVPAGAILIPRNLRAMGRVYRLTQDTFVSTNFFVINGLSKEESVMVSSWMNTIFYQISCELNSKNQEGTRKMEKAEITETYIPNISRLSEENKRELLETGNRESFIVLKQPQIRRIDQVWAKIIFGDNHEPLLRKAKDLLTRLANTRDAD